MRHFDCIQRSHQKSNTIIHRGLSPKRQNLKTKVEICNEKQQNRDTPWLHTEVLSAKQHPHVIQGSPLQEVKFENKGWGHMHWNNKIILQQDTLTAHSEVLSASNAHAGIPHDVKFENEGGNTAIVNEQEATCCWNNKQYELILSAQWR